MPANMTHAKRLDELFVLLLSILMRYVNFSGICVCVVAGVLLLTCVAAVQRRRYSQDQVTGMFVTLNATMIASRISAYVYNKAVLQVLFTSVLANGLRWLFPIDLMHQVEDRLAHAFTWPITNNDELFGAMYDTVAIFVMVKPFMTEMLSNFDRYMPGFMSVCFILADDIPRCTYLIGPETIQALCQIAICACGVVLTYWVRKLVYNIKSVSKLESEVEEMLKFIEYIENLQERSMRPRARPPTIIVTHDGVRGFTLPVEKGRHEPGLYWKRIGGPTYDESKLTPVDRRVAFHNQRLMEAKQRRKLQRAEEERQEYDNLYRKLVAQQRSELLESQTQEDLDYLSDTEGSESE